MSMFVNYARQEETDEYCIFIYILFTLSMSLQKSSCLQRKYCPLMTNLTTSPKLNYKSSGVNYTVSIQFAVAYTAIKQ